MNGGEHGSNPRSRHFDGHVYSPRCLRSRLNAAGSGILLLLLFLLGLVMGWIVRGWLERGYIFR